jgi:multidrug efflux pump subunit AcrA (membrane-fusion protein)
MKPLQRQFFVNTAWLGILGGVFALLSAGCGPRDGEKKRDIPLPSVAVEEVAALDFERVLSLTATVEPAVTAILSSPAEGPVVFADIREGDTVASGQELFRIGRRDYADAALASARAELMRQIHTGPSQDGRVVVAEGLRPGEQVVVQGFERIQEGTPVKVMSAASDPAESSPAPRP